MTFRCDVMMIKIIMIIYESDATRFKMTTMKMIAIMLASQMRAKM